MKLTEAEKKEKFRQAIDSGLRLVAEKEFAISRLPAEKQAAFEKKFLTSIKLIVNTTVMANNTLLQMRNAKSDKEESTIKSKFTDMFPDRRKLFYRYTMQIAGTLGLAKDDLYVEAGVDIIRKNLKIYFPYTFRVHENSLFSYGMMYYIVVMEIGLKAAKLNGLKIKMHKPPTVT